MDVSDKAFSCAGHEDEFNRKHAASGWAIFFAVIIPIGIASAVGFWVWRNWTGKFGQIRLGEQGSLYLTPLMNPTLSFEIYLLT